VGGEGRGEAFSEKIKNSTNRKHAKEEQEGRKGSPSTVFSDYEEMKRKQERISIEKKKEEVEEQMGKEVQ